MPAIDALRVNQLMIFLLIGRLSWRPRPYPRALAPLLLAKHPPRVLDPAFRPRCWSVTSARARRTAHSAGTSEAGHGRVVVTVERAHVDRVCGAAGRAAHPQEPITGGNGGADRRREQHRHALGLPLVPAVIRCSASSSTWASVARRPAASFSAACRR
jgi:hypothetical protein